MTAEQKKKKKKKHSITTHDQEGINTPVMTELSPIRGLYIEIQLYQSPRDEALINHNNIILYNVTPTLPTNSENYQCVDNFLISVFASWRILQALSATAVMINTRACKK